MRKILLLFLFITLPYGFIQPKNVSIPIFSQPAYSNDQILKNAFQNGKSDIQVQGQGTVVTILADDLDGSKHQKFLVKLNSGQTVLIAHNIDLAPRINSLKKGDFVVFYGEYEWSSKGGTIHWTHHDPNKKHVDGWIKHNGKIYK